ncbi:hypothetical protein XENOCAPTIV_023167 [Xenoophorus captivus]|uniref:SH3 domain-containing protein n=1 Tax=Xenoophorus captivus TaxID=1517983 RepID=A0ABV0RXG9_9TELE
MLHDVGFYSGPRCVALFDYEGEDDDELTFSQGDVIGLLELVDEEWGRGQIHGRTGIFPLNFTEVVELLPEPTSSPGETSKQESAETGGTENCEWRRGRLDGREGLYPAAFTQPCQGTKDPLVYKAADLGSKPPLRL